MHRRSFFVSRWIFLCLFCCRLVLKGDTTEVTANAIGLTMESNGIQILEPFDTYVKYSNASRKTNIHLSISEIFMNFSFRSLRLFLAVEEDILEFLRMTSKKMTVVCSQFDKVGTIRSMDTIISLFLCKITTLLINGIKTMYL